MGEALEWRPPHSFSHLLPSGLPRRSPSRELYLYHLCRLPRLWQCGRIEQHGAILQPERSGCGQFGLRIRGRQVQPDDPKAHAHRYRQHISGVGGFLGTNDATGSDARFNNPSGTAVDGAGNVYVADYQNNTIRKITPAGVVTTLAGLGGVAGTNNGTGTAARFNQPYGLAVDGAGNVYVADSFNQTIRKVTAQGVVSTLAGLAGVAGTNNGTGSAARFNEPAAVALDAVTNLFVADYLNNTIRKVTQAGVVTTMAGQAGVSGTNNGTGKAAQFYHPTGLAMDSLTNLYVTDYVSSTIRKVTPAGVVTTIAGSPYQTASADGTNGAARFYGPIGLARDGAGTLFVADSVNGTIRTLTLIGTNWVVGTFAGVAAGHGNKDGTGSFARFGSPNSVAADSSNYVYVADDGLHTIRKISPSGLVTTLAGMSGVSGTNDGTGSAARFNHPEGLCVDKASNVYVADQYNSTIRKITPLGVVTTIAGLAGISGSADGTNSAARFNDPSHVAVDPVGSVYVADSMNDTIRRVQPIGADWVVTTLAGQAGVAGSSDGTNSTAQFDSPYGVAVDVGTNIYVADLNNQTIRRVKPVGTNWVVTTLAGVVQAIGNNDGTGSQAAFNYPNDVAVDRLGNLFVADTYNDAVRKIAPVGNNWEVTTIGGLGGVTTGTAGIADGTGSTARFNFPAGVAVDSSTNVYVADYYNITIRKGVTTASLPPVELLSPTLSAGEFGFWMSGFPDLALEIETTTNLNIWQPLGSYV